MKCLRHIRFWGTERPELIDLVCLLPYTLLIALFCNRLLAVAAYLEICKKNNVISQSDFYDKKYNSPALGGSCGGN